MDLKNLKCDSHKSPVVCFCLYGPCKQRKCCSKCIAFNHNNCEQNFIFLEDVMERNTDAFLRLSVVDSIFSESEIDSFKKREDSTGRVNQDINMLFSNFLDKFSSKIIEYQEKMEETVMKEAGETNHAEQVNNILGIEHLRRIMTESEEDEFQEKFSQLDIITNLDAVKERLYEVKDNLSQSLNKAEVEKSLGLAFEAILAQVDKNLNPNNLFDKKKAKFDTVLTSDKIELFGNNLQAIKDGNLSYTATLLNFEMEPMTGTYMWNLQLGGLAVSPSHTDNQWICFGIVSKDNWVNLENFNYSNTVGLSTFFQLYGNIKITKNNINKVFEDKVFNCKFDTAKNQFSITYQDKFFAEATVRPNIYRPFIILYGTGNTVKIL